MMLKWLGLLCLVACNPPPPTATKKQFRIYVFDAATTGSLGDTRESAWAVLQEIPLDQSAYTITEDLITAYDWVSQTFTMTNEWGERGEQAPGIMWGGDAAFLVTFNGQRLFGGRIVSQISARLFNYPAMVLAFESQPSKNGPFSKPLIYAFLERAPSHFAPSQPRFLADDSEIAEQVRQHLAVLGKIR